MCYENYFTEIIKSFDKYPEVEVIGGKLIPIFSECDPPQWVSKYIDGILSKLDLEENEKLFEGEYPIGCNMAYGKSIFNKVGGFNEDLVYGVTKKICFFG